MKNNKFLNAYIYFVISEYLYFYRECNASKSKEYLYNKMYEFISFHTNFDLSGKKHEVIKKILEFRKIMGKIAGFTVKEVMPDVSPFRRYSRAKLLNGKRNAFLFYVYKSVWLNDALGGRIIDDILNDQKLTDADLSGKFDRLHNQMREYLHQHRRKLKVINR